MVGIFYFIDEAMSLYTYTMIEIREARIEDVATVYKLGENVSEFHTSDQAPNFWPEQVLRNSVAKDDVSFFVAQVDGEIAGFIIANLNKSLSKTEIENVFVRADFRRQGIGASLARKVVEVAKLNKYQFISVLTPPDDIAAIKTYEGVGFTKGETFLWLDIA
jgi:ribosomal protein S18 acetylase RimI-like enzyme